MGTSRHVRACTRPRRLRSRAGLRACRPRIRRQLRHRPAAAPARTVGPSYEQKIVVDLKLEDERRLREPAPAPRRRRRSRRQCAAAALRRPPPPPPAPPDLVRMLADAEARVRAARHWPSAVSDLREGVQPLIAVLADPGSGSASDGGIRHRTHRRHERPRRAGDGAEPIRVRS